MNSRSAGNAASTEPTRTPSSPAARTAGNAPTRASTRGVSPAARKFAKYLAHRWAPMIESATKRSEEPQQGNDAVVVLTQRKRG